jgi:hypothetical protein
MSASQGGLPSLSPAGQDISDLAARLGIATGSFADRGGPGSTNSDNVAILSNLGYGIGALDLVGSEHEPGDFNFNLRDFRRWSGNPEWWGDVDSFDKTVAKFQERQALAAGQEAEAQSRQDQADNSKGDDADYQQGVATVLQSDLENKTIRLLRDSVDDAIQGSLAIKPVPALQAAADPSTLAMADGLGDKANALLAGLKDGASTASQWALNKAKDSAIGKVTGGVRDLLKAGANMLAGEGTGENLEKVIDSQGAVEDNSMGVLNMVSNQGVQALVLGSPEQVQAHGEQAFEAAPKTFKTIIDMISK